MQLPSNISTARIVIISPSRKNPLNEADLKARILKLEEKTKQEIAYIPSFFEAKDKASGGSILERALTLSLALTRRNIETIWCARGGSGATELLPYLEKILPPIIPDKTFIGYSDSSILGLYLSSRYPNLRFIHARHACTPNTLDPGEDNEILFSLIKKDLLAPATFKSQIIAPALHNLEGICIPSNLSLCENLCTIKNFSFPENTILFLEDIDETSRHVLRKIDSLILSEKLSSVKALVFGEVTYRELEAQNPLLQDFECVAFKTGLPVYHLPIFGHGKECYPLVAHSKVSICESKITLSQTPIKRDFLPQDVFKKETPQNLYIMGIAGTATSSLASLLLQKKKTVSGSDQNVYPPISHVLDKLKIKYEEGFKAENIKGKNHDAVIVSNVMSPFSSQLKRNEELDYFIGQTVIQPYSLASCLRHTFLKNSTNILVSGTHGKTTTTTILKEILESVKINPSYLIAGVPQNQDKSAQLRSQDCFVIEADEYDTAFFDKGPKFLHYEPYVTIINNIEFDHADIYPSLESIEKEFERLIHLTQLKEGVVVGNYDDQRVRNLILKSGCQAIFFSIKKQKIPCWHLKSVSFHREGMHLEVLSPSKQLLSLKTGLFGEHNAQNILAGLAGLHAYQLKEFSKKEESKRSSKKPLSSKLNFGKFVKEFRLSTIHLRNIKSKLNSFKGVKRRFECLFTNKELVVFDDFAHHPTAVEKTIKAFRSYIKATKEKNKRLIVCLDLRNATLRRNIFEKDLVNSLQFADIVLLGPVLQDLRIPENQRMNTEHIKQNLSPHISYCERFDKSEDLLHSLSQTVTKGDVVVFMSSGSFDGLPFKFIEQLKKSKIHSRNLSKSSRR